MQWPRTPVERVNYSAPPFCPWPACPEHLRRRPGFRFRHHGTYATRRRCVPRFLCLTCRRTFSRQTFSTSYYLKRPELVTSSPRAQRRVGPAAGRPLPGVRPPTPSRLAARLGRHTLLLHARSLAFLRRRLDEPVVLDHFETFEFTQDYPFGVATPVGLAPGSPTGSTLSRTPGQADALRRSRRGSSRGPPAVARRIRRVHPPSAGHPSAAGPGRRSPAPAAMATPPDAGAARERPTCPAAELPESTARAAWNPALRGRPRPRRRHVRRRFRTPSCATPKTPSSGDHRLRQAPQRADRAALPLHGVAQLREAPVGAPPGAGDPGDAPRLGHGTLVMEEGPVAPTVPDALVPDADGRADYQRRWRLTPLLPRNVIHALKHAY